MKFWKKAGSTMAAVAVAGGVALAAAPAASAINQVDCAGRDDFYKVRSFRGSLCFANAGITGTFQQDTRDLSTGNNTGNIYYYNHADGRNWYSRVRYPGYHGFFDWPFVNTLAVRIF